MATRDDLLRVLANHQGALNGVSVEVLAHTLDVPPRRVRSLVTEAREEGVAICGHPKEGYYIAVTAQELEETCQFLRARAMHSLMLEARLRKLPLPELIGQLRLKT